MVDFSTLAREAFQWGRVGYTIHNQHQGQGYGTEAVDLAMRIAFDDLHFQRIKAHINLDNEASIRLAEHVVRVHERRVYLRERRLDRPSRLRENEAPSIERLIIGMVR